MGYKDPALEGQSITFTCAPGQVLNGSNQSTCMGNGKWEPDLGEVECIGEQFNPALLHVCVMIYKLVIHNIHVGPGSQATTTTSTITTLQPTNCMHQDTCSRPGKL